MKITHSTFARQPGPLDALNALVRYDHTVRYGMDEQPDGRYVVFDHVSAILAAKCSAWTIDLSTSNHIRIFNMDSMLLNYRCAATAEKAEEFKVAILSAIREMTTSPAPKQQDEGELVAPVSSGVKPAGFDVCPISGRPFWGNIDHPERGLVATYGGPYDTYSIPYLNEDNELRVERFDQDRGEWIEGGEPFGWFYDEQRTE